MRLARRLTACAAAALMMTGALSATQASATTSATITNVTLSRASVAVSGLNTLPVTWTVSINDPGGMKVTQPSGGSGVVTWKYPRLVLQKVSGNGWVPQMVVSLCPVGQTDNGLCSTPAGITSGDWAGTIQVPSTANGVWAVAGIWVSGPAQSPTLVAAPSGMPTLAVTGVHMPALSVGTSPNPVVYKSAFAFKGSLYDAQTAKLFFGTVNVGTVLSATNDECLNGNGHGTHEYFTQGHAYSAAIPAAESNGPVHFCLDVLQRIDLAKNSDGERQEIVRRMVYPPTHVATGGIFPGTSFKRGTVVTVAGQAVPAAVALSGCTAEVVYLYGRTALRAAGSPAVVRSSGRITLTFTVLPGRLAYKVYFPRCGAGGAWLAATGRPVTITGT
jgi:hypothetical protein